MKSERAPKDHTAMDHTGHEDHTGMVRQMREKWRWSVSFIGLAFVGWLASRYLAAFQLGYITTIWDPFFAHGTVNVLHSDVSKAFPISDAGLGAAAYTLEMLMGWMGGKERWRSMPWMVFIFFILVVPLGIVSMTLIILQPLAVGSWCSVCVFTALVMLLMIPFAVGEVVARGSSSRGACAKASRCGAPSGSAGRSPR